MQTNERLSRERSQAPEPIIDQDLVNVPHTYFKVYGLGDMLSLKGATLTVDQRYQNVRIVAVYQTDQVRVGEFCRFGGTVGTVEEVGLRSTRVRTLDRTIVTIPNSEFSNFQIENFARRDRIWYHPTIRLRYETTPDQIRYILVEVHRVLYAHPKVDSATARIRFVGFGNSSLDLEVFSYVTVRDYGEYLEVAEDLNLRIMDVVAAAGSSFALPAQTTYLKAGRGLDPDRAQATEAEVQAWRERRELWVPRLPPEKIAEIESTLDYPAHGSAPSTEGGRR